jgi:hypothetical protein
MSLKGKLPSRGYDENVYDRVFSLFGIGRDEVNKSWDAEREGLAAVGLSSKYRLQ